MSNKIFTEASTKSTLPIMVMKPSEIIPSMKKNGLVIVPIGSISKKDKKMIDGIVDEIKSHGLKRNTKTKGGRLYLKEGTKVPPTLSAMEWMHLASTKPDENVRYNTSSSEYDVGYSTDIAKITSVDPSIRKVRGIFFALNLPSENNGSLFYGI